MKRVLVMALLVAAAGLMLTALAAGLWWRAVHAPLALSEQKTLMVESGASAARVAQSLEQQGMLGDRRLFTSWARFQGQERAIRSGEYLVQPGASTADLLSTLVAGRTVQHPVTLIEGWRMSQVLESLWQNDVVSNTLEGLDEEEILSRLGLSFPALEGLVYPDTYLVTRGTSDESLLRRASSRLQQVLDEEWQHRDVGLPYASPYEALIMASIVEKESGYLAEKPRVAGVFVRRLNEGMRLQSDPTVIYGVGQDYTGVIRRVDLDTTTPWNTYRINGLPPTPIAIVARDAIRAALQPADEPYFYFVSRGDGTHHFSETLQQHNAAVRRYIRGEPDDSND